MYARSTTIAANISAIDAGIAHVRDEVQPALVQLDGYIGLSMMVDRATGMCITTSAWRDARAMHASKSQAQLVRERAAEILGGSPVIEEWEIAVMHRDHPTHGAAWVRSAWLRADLRRMDETVDVYRTMALPQIEQLDGFCSANLMVDRDTGRAVTTVCFDSEAALRASRENSGQIRSAAAVQASVAVVQVSEFELAVAHLRIPEMA